MKLLIFLVLIAMVVVNGMTSYTLFRHSFYDLSNLLYIAAFASTVFGIFVLTSKSPKPAHIK